MTRQHERGGRRIALVQVEDLAWAAGTVDSHRRFNVAEPLGLLSLEAYVAREGHCVELFHPRKGWPRVLDDDQLARDVIAFRPDIVGISAMTVQVPGSHRLARVVKRALPRAAVVVGGDHFSTCPGDLASFEAFDGVVAGEGEANLDWIARHVEEGAPTADLPAGVFWKSGSEIRGGGLGAGVARLDDLPWPSRHRGLLRSSSVGALMWPPRSEQTGAVSVSLSRGCPYTCTYCDAKAMWGGRVRWRTPADVARELTAVRRQHGVNCAFVVDLTFNVRRDVCLEFCREMKRQKPGVSWYVLLRPGNPNDRVRADAELLEALRDAGCTKVGFGLETIDEQIGTDLRRKPNTEYLRWLLRVTDGLGMLSKVFLMIGHPDEDAASYYGELAQTLESLGPDEVRVSFLTPFPGTALWVQHRNRVRADVDYSRYTTFEPILQHPAMTFEALRDVRFRLLARYYSSPGYRARVTDKIGKFSHLDRSFGEFFDELGRGLPRPSASTSRPTSCGGRLSAGGVRPGIGDAAVGRGAT